MSQSPEISSVGSFKDFVELRVGAVAASSQMGPDSKIWREYSLALAAERERMAGELGITPDQLHNDSINVA